MDNVPPPAEELGILDRELRQLDARRAQLLTRRAWLLAALQPPVAPGAPPAPPRAGFGPPNSAPGGFGRPFAAPAGPDTSPPGVQNVLLTLGGILLTVAAIAFTLVSWGAMGIGGRSAVLGAVTVAALGTPYALLRRGLVATAESIAVLGLVLMVLDAYALHRAVLPETDGLGYAAFASAALAALWSAYGLWLPRLHTPLPAAVVAAQLPLPLWALTAGAGAPPMEWALLLTAALDVAVVVWTRPVPVRVTAGVAAAVTGGGALLIGAFRSLAADSPSAAANPAVLLVAAAAVALFTAWRVPAVAGVSAVAGLAAVAGVGGVVRATVPGVGWAVIGYLLCGTALMAVVRAPVPRRLLPGLAGASAVVHAASALMALPLSALALAGPVTALTDVWSGTSPLPDPDSTATTLLPAPLALLITAAVLVAASHDRGTPSAADATGSQPPSAATGTMWPARGDRLRTAARCGALVLVWAAFVAVPVVFGFGHSAAVLWQLAPTLGLPAAAAWRQSGAMTSTALACALTGSVSVALLSLATRPATFAVLGVLVGACVVAAVRARGPLQALLACTATVFATGFAGAAAAALELPAHRAAPLLLTVPALTALLGARLRRHPAALPVEVTGSGAALVALLLAAGHLPTLALVLALCGVIAAGTAVRAERRPVAGYLAVALFVLATWVRLAASDVVAPEAYSLPVTVPALAVGALRRRKDPQASSWTAYGPGLAATLVPSLVAAWGDEHWLRPLLLGVAALAVTLAGARLRLQALLMLGGAVLALDALHELAPYVVQAVGALPRWLPPALVGLLLLAVGATYEQRLRDARKLRESLGRMR
ncbi:SCO7613 C-terminal domain-containing membrane protein [Streptomyces sp. NPDC096176]|uniref:SCO7613 C-terminal domain-containing membrane protein n=1 Tax=Streptomyces sp. NPDC096176 TaxID=3366079 RepID=UPI003826129E